MISVQLKRLIKLNMTFNFINNRDLDNIIFLKIFYIFMILLILITLFILIYQILCIINILVKALGSDFFIILFYVLSLKILLEFIQCNRLYVQFLLILFKSLLEILK